MKNFGSYSQCSHLNVMTIFPSDWVDAQKVYRGLDAFRLSIVCMEFNYFSSSLHPSYPLCVCFLPIHSGWGARNFDEKKQ